LAAPLPIPRRSTIGPPTPADAGRDALQAARPVIADIERKLRQELGSADTERLTALLGRVADVVKDDRVSPRRTAAAGEA